jgi:CRP-like cAMP-binding protein
MAEVMPSKGELKKNLRSLQERLKEHPMDLDARMRVARTHRLLGRGDDAVAHYAAVARYLSLAGHPLQAIAVLKELLQVDPKHDETLLFLAKLYARTRAADTTNRGRVAVPILEPGDLAAGIETLHDGVPLTSTGIWRAISPIRADEMSKPGAPSPPLLQEAEVDAGDVVEETDLELTRKAHDDAAEGVPDVDFGDDYEVLGQMTTGDVLLPQVPLFSSLSPEAFMHLSHAMIFQKAKAGSVIFEQGQPGDSCIVISRGRAHVQRSGIDLMHLSEGDIAGVFALMAAQTRQASLTALTDLEYFEIDRVAVDDLIHAHPAMKATLARFFRERLIQALLASLPFFQNLDVAARQELVKRFSDRDYEPGDELFFEGAENDGLWVVLEGRVQVGASINLAPGDYVGSLARIDTAQADLGAVARTVAKCAMLPHKAFSELLEKHDITSVRERFQTAGVMVGAHVFAGNGTVQGQLVGLR